MLERPKNPAPAGQIQQLLLLVFNIYDMVLTDCTLPSPRPLPPEAPLAITSKSSASECYLAGSR